MVTGESTKYAVKPLRGECRVISGVTVVITLVCLFFYTRGCGCIERPAFPAPSDFSGAGRFCKTSGEIAPRDRGGATSLRGATRRSNPFFLGAGHGLLRLR